MKQCAVVSFVTPNQYVLKGLWFGPEDAQTGLIFLHGLASSAFSHHDLLLPLVNKSTVALYFNNRGHDKIGKIRKLTPGTKKGYESELIGEAHEVFTDCADDIQGAVNFLKESGVKNIYLVGHSTGCQKSIYYLSRAGSQAQVKGVVLICPISDYSYSVAHEDPKKLKQAVEYARGLIKQGKPHELLPLDICEDLHDAQRYLSLNTPDSEEEIFTYCQPGKIPKTLQEVKTPTLVIFAEQDEYADRPAAEIGAWFKKTSKASELKVKTVKRANHNLADREAETAGIIEGWVQGYSG
jgi:pimeloyl-ACP methyl ester carboxylesterase